MYNINTYIAFAYCTLPITPPLFPNAYCLVPAAYCPVPVAYDQTGKWVGLFVSDARGLTEFL